MPGTGEMGRITCRGCESRKLEPFLDLGEMPSAGGFLANRETIAHEKFYPLKVHICEVCGLVQILDAIAPDVLFEEYSFASSTVGPLVRHFKDYASWLRQAFSPRVVVEFGCNDGILLSPLKELGITAFGVDISRNVTEMARAKGLDVLTGYFDDMAAEQIERRLGKVDVVTGSNAFAHNDNPEGILRAARRILKAGGHLCLEVMYVGDLLQSMQWDTLYHEHLTFYCLATLQTLLRRFGFYVIDAERIPMHGGSLRVVAATAPDEAVRPAVNTLLGYEKQVAMIQPSTWLAFGQESKRKIDIVRRTFDAISENSRIWAYGAAGKATMWVNACKMSYLEAVVDESPLRAGKLMPGIHTPIVPPKDLRKDPPHYIFVTAWNYADLIRSKESWYDGIWSVPLPELKFW